MRLFTIGDSVSQGFMSLAAARPAGTYSTLIANALKIDSYQVPEWPAGGIPANLERVMRALDRFGANVGGPFEWSSALARINGVLDEAEDDYERGDGKLGMPDPSGVGSWPNFAYYGMDVADAWLVTPRVCQEVIEGSRAATKDNWPFGTASDAFYRSAYRMLNPKGYKKYLDYSAIQWLSEHAEREGVENTIIWLGPNNALGTVLRLKVKQTPGHDGRQPHEMSHLERKGAGWNLWHPDDFDAEYESLIVQVNKALEGNQIEDDRVFVGTVPYVTIIPLAKGVGEQTYAEGFGWYFKYYVYFPFEEADVKNGVPHLTLAEAMLIDRSIEQYNIAIRKLVGEANAALGRERYHIVDTNKALTQLAWKRNGGLPTYDLPKRLAFRHPQVNTKYYHANRNGELRQGGIFSLDGVHPTEIGHSLIAREFLKKMHEVGVTKSDGSPIDADTDLPWDEIVRSDTLYRTPIRQMTEIYENRKLLEFVLKCLGTFEGRT